MRTQLSLVLPSALALASLAGLAAAQQTERVSISNTNAQANDASEYPSVSADGDVVGFHSAATNLIGLLDLNGKVDVFVRVRGAGLTQRVSVGPLNVEGDGHSSRASVSDDGLRIAFQSFSTNFVTPDLNGVSDVFVRDRGLATTTCVSVDSFSVLGNGTSGFASISPEGRYVAFQSDATNLDLANADSNLATDVFLRDTQLGTTVRISVRQLGFGSIVEGDGPSTAPVAAANGAFIAFASSATNLLATADLNGVDDVFLWDSSGTIRRISDGPGGFQADGACGAPSISSDGRFVAFESLATDLGLPAADVNGTWDVYVWDDATGAITLASCDHGQYFAGDDESRAPSLSDDGRYVSFASYATNLVWCDTNSARDVFRRDLGRHFTLRLSVGALAIDGNAPSDLVVPSALSADGHVAAFSSHATNLIAVDTNGFGDVFVRVPDDAQPFTVSYCTPGTTSSLCTPTMTMIGAPSVSERAGCELTATNLDGGRNGIIFYGNTGPVAAPWGVGSSSILCVKAPQQRTGTMYSGGTDGACDGMLSLDFRDYTTCKPFVLGTPLNVGEVIWAQGWFRDSAAVKATNLTNGLQFTLVP